MLYRLLRPLLYLLSAESAHHLVISLLKLVQRVPGFLSLSRRFFEGPRGIGIEAFGRHFESPVGLAAGFDKNAEVFPALFGLGFGSVEVGTLTGQAQPGNPLPRLFRLPRDRALVNRMGFNNKGAEAAAEYLAQHASGKGGVLGINIGKTKLVPAEQAVDDYEHSARVLGPFADYLVVNVSSPNTPGLRDLQAVSSLGPILSRVKETLREVSPHRRVPLLVKIAPDLSDEDVIAVADLALELGLDGIVATNTTISREGLSTPRDRVEACGAGGLSGAPLKARALAVLRLLYRHTQGKLTLISVGGIETADEAWERIESGATLLQIYSGLVYAGPSLPSRLSQGLAKRLNDSGFARLADVVGSRADVPYHPTP